MGSGKFHSCKSIWEDNLCLLGILVPLLQLLKYGKHMQLKIFHFHLLLYSKTYALNKLHNHLLSKGIYRCKSPYGSWQCSQHLWHNCLDDKGPDILYEQSHCQGQSHRLHLYCIHCYCYNLPQHMQLEGCLANQEGKHKWQCESQLHTQPCCHIE